MKKVILMALAAALVAVPAAQAQKVNKTALLEKIEKSDAEIADAKKAAKAATWINRGKAFYEAAAEPAKSLFVNMDANMMKVAVGEPTSKGKETVNGNEYVTWVYPYLTAYLKDNKLVTWKQTKVVVKDAIEKAFEAYNKAIEVDPKSAEKLKVSYKQLSDFCSQVGNTSMDAGDFAAAAQAYADAFKIQSAPAYGQPADATLLYYAGYLCAMDGATNPKSFAKGEEYLNKALSLNYADENGSIYYYMFHCLYGQKAEKPENIVKAKDALLEGIGKFPKNERILEGLMQLYTTEKGVGDPADLIVLIDKAIAENPDNMDLLYGRGRIYYALKDYDKSAESFKMVAEKQPDLFESNYSVGIVYAFKGDEMNNELNKNPYTSQAAYDADLKAVNAVYMQALPWFEKAHKIKPQDEATIELLKQLCFRLRDEEGILDKYNTYNALYKKMKGLE